MLDINDTLANVRELQTMLRVLSIFDTRIPPLVSDGVLGEATVDAVRAFQSAYGLVPTGEVDCITWDTLTAAYNSTLLLQERGNAVYPLVHPEILASLPLSVPLVEIVQVLLRAVSTHIGFSTPVDITGRYDEGTASAIALLQGLYGLETTGALDLPTWNVLAATYNLEMQKLASRPPIKDPV